MSYPTAHKMQVTFQASPEYLDDIHLNLLQAIEEWNALTPEEKQQRIMQRDQRLAAESTLKCGDLLDVLTGDYGHRHTYACQEPLGHDGEHYGPELSDSDEWADMGWTDDHTGRRANQ